MILILIWIPTLTVLSRLQGMLLLLLLLLLLSPTLNPVRYGIMNLLKAYIVWYSITVAFWILTVYTANRTYTGILRAVFHPEGQLHTSGVLQGLAKTYIVGVVSSAYSML